MKCPYCDGKGLFWHSRDLHRSAGSEPCIHCDKGSISDEKYLDYLDMQKKIANSRYKQFKQKMKSR